MIAADHLPRPVEHRDGPVAGDAPSVEQGADLLRRDGEAQGIARLALDDHGQDRRDLIAAGALVDEKIRYLGLAGLQRLDDGDVGDHSRDRRAITFPRIEQRLAVLVAEHDPAAMLPAHLLRAGVEARDVAVPERLEDAQHRQRAEARFQAPVDGRGDGAGDAEDLPLADLAFLRVEGNHRIDAQHQRRHEAAGDDQYHVKVEGPLPLRKYPHPHGAPARRTF